MTGCRIGKVKFKSGGSLTILPSREQNYFENCARLFRDLIPPEKNCRAIGFFIMHDNGHVKTGFAWNNGTHLSHMYGAVEQLKNDIARHWEAC